MGAFYKQKTFLNQNVLALECDNSLPLCVPGINSRHMSAHPGCSRPAKAAINRRTPKSNPLMPTMFV
jgi:hypothetical protein